MGVSRHSDVFAGSYQMDTGSPLGEKAINSTLGALTAAWAQREQALLSLRKAEGARKSAIKKQNKAEAHLQSAEAVYRPRIEALKAEYYIAEARQRKTVAVPIEGIELISRIEGARQRLENCASVLAKADGKQKVARDRFELADSSFRSAVIGLAEVPTQWRPTASVEIIDDAGSVSIVFAADMPEWTNGRYILHANGVLEKLREATYTPTN